MALGRVKVEQINPEVLNQIKSDLDLAVEEFKKMAEAMQKAAEELNKSVKRTREAALELDRSAARQMSNVRSGLSGKAGKSW